LTRALVFLVGAVVFEVSWAVMLKASRGLLFSWSTLGMLITYLLSLYCLNVACRGLPLSVAYAVWTGSGASIVALIGVFAFKESISVGQFAGLVLVVLGVVMLLGLASTSGSPQQG
jgi:multidrug transporter EmrE-like cation transporter